MLCVESLHLAKFRVRETSSLIKSGETSQVWNRHKRIWVPWWAKKLGWRHTAEKENVPVFELVNTEDPNTWILTFLLSDDWEQEGKYKEQSILANTLIVKSGNWWPNFKLSKSHSTPLLIMIWDFGGVCTDSSASLSNLWLSITLSSAEVWNDFREA